MKRVRPCPEREAGLGLVEVMVAMAVFVVGSLSLLPVLASSMAGTYDNRARLTGAQLAASDIDAARSADYYSLATVAPRVEVVDGRPYTVVREVAITMSAAGGTGSCVASGSARQINKKISTRVTAAFRSSSTRPVRADTVVQAPLFNPNSDHGAISFRVVDRHAAPLPGLLVSIPGLPARPTDANGCVYFDVAPLGSVPVTVAKPGWVTVAGSTTLTKSVTVRKGQVSVDSLRIGPPVPIKVTGNVYDGPAVASGFGWPKDLAATIAAPDRASVTNVIYSSQPLTPGVPRTFSAFPSRGGYDVYAGRCSAVVRTDSEPGTSPDVVLPLSPVTVNLVIPGPQDLKGRDKFVRISWRPTTTPVCAETEVLEYTVKTPSTCTHQCTVKVAVPAGTWLITALGTGDALSPDKTAPVVVLPKTALTVDIDVR